MFLVTLDDPFDEFKLVDNLYLYIQDPVLTERSLTTVFFFVVVVSSSSLCVFRVLFVRLGVVCHINLSP
jgi:hypothetical protein